MNRFNKYILKLDELAEKTAKLATDLDANYNTAKQKCAYYRADRIGAPSNGALDPEDYVKAMEWKAKLAAAEQMRNKFWDNLPFNIAQEIKEIRGEFAAALDDTYSADPAALDAATITLLESGICDAHEYARLLDTAIKKGNTTLARVIGVYAGKAAEKEDADPINGNPRKATEYRVVSRSAADFGKIADSYMAHFDVYAEAIQRATANPAMFEGDTLAEFSAGALQAFDSLT